MLTKIIVSNLSIVLVLVIMVSADELHGAYYFSKCQSNDHETIIYLIGWDILSIKTKSRVV